MGNFARTWNHRGLAAQVGSLALYGLNWMRLTQSINNVQAITASDVQKFAGGVSTPRARTSSSSATPNVHRDLRKRFRT